MKSQELIRGVQAAFGVGGLYHDKSWDGWVFWVSSYTELGVLEEYFQKNPLVSYKAIEFKRFFELVSLMQQGYHLKNAPASYRSLFESQLKIFFNEKAK